MNIKGVIFDLDGTLLDSMSIWDTIGEDYLIHQGIKPEKGLNEKLKTMSIRQAAEYYRKHYEITESVEEIMIGVNGMLEDFYRNVVQVKGGVLSILEEFKKKGVKMCIATATDRYLVEAALKNNGINEYFSHIFTCNEVGFGKDHPVIYEKALKEMATNKEETLVFEDALHAIITLSREQFKIVGVFDPSSKSDQEKIKELSLYYLETFEDWRKL